MRVCARAREREKIRVRAAVGVCVRARGMAVYGRMGWESKSWTRWRRSRDHYRDGRPGRWPREREWTLKNKINTSCAFGRDTSRFGIVSNVHASQRSKSALRFLLLSQLKYCNNVDTLILLISGNAVSGCRLYVSMAAANSPGANHDNVVARGDGRLLTFKGHTLIIWTVNCWPIM